MFKNNSPLLSFSSSLPHTRPISNKQTTQPSETKISVNFARTSTPASNVLHENTANKNYPERKSPSNMSQNAFSSKNHQNKEEIDNRVTQVEKFNSLQFKQRNFDQNHNRLEKKSKHIINFISPNKTKNNIIQNSPLQQKLDITDDKTQKNVNKNSINLNTSINDDVITQQNLSKRVSKNDSPYLNTITDRQKNKELSIQKILSESRIRSYEKQKQIIQKALNQSKSQLSIQYTEIARLSMALSEYKHENQQMINKIQHLEQALSSKIQENKQQFQLFSEQRQRFTQQRVDKFYEERVNKINEELQKRSKLYEEALQLKFKMAEQLKIANDKIAVLTFELKKTKKDTKQSPTQALKQINPALKQAVEDSFKNYEKQIESLKEIIDNLNQKLKQKDQTIAQKNRKISELQQQLKILNFKSQSQKNNLTIQHQSTLTQREHQIKSLSNRIKMFEERLNAAKQQIQAKDTFFRQHLVGRIKDYSLKENINELLLKYTKTFEDRHQLQKRVEILQQQLISKHI